jgi:nucleoside-diphosphate-sugar epimerase
MMSDANILVMNDERANYQAFNVGGNEYTVEEFADIAREFKKEHIKPNIP